MTRTQAREQGSLQDEGEVIMPEQANTLGMLHNNDVVKGLLSGSYFSQDKTGT